MRLVLVATAVLLLCPLGVAPRATAADTPVPGPTATTLAGEEALRRGDFAAAAGAFAEAARLGRAAGDAEQELQALLQLSDAQQALGNYDDALTSLTRARELAEASGLSGFAGQSTAYDTPNASHVGGTCRMGRDPTRSVVDASGAVHGLPNLVIADASVLVTEGAGDSPSLTIQALALRSAELLAERAGRGEI